MLSAAFLLQAALLVPGLFCCAKRFSFPKLFGGTKLPGGGPCPCHWDSTQPAVPPLLETVPSMFQRLREESPPGEAQLRAPGGDFAERGRWLRAL